MTTELVATRRPRTHAPSLEEPVLPSVPLREGRAFHVTRSSPQLPSSLLGRQCPLCFTLEGNTVRSQG